ncbi:general substrate transporter [Pelagophyceae sp. CCMP2097]|nr:general substrate transporter [Pelagophyceae sp. CCMP2097]
MRRPVPYVYFLAFIASLNSINLGYDMGVMSGAALYINESLELSEVQLELLVGSLNFWAIGGAFAAHYVNDRFGRRRTFTVSCLIFVTGNFCMALAPSYALLMFGRAITGVGVGVGLSVDPVYIAEVAPKEHRGALVNWSEISITIGLLSGFCASYVFRNLPADLAWRAMLGCGGIMPLVLFILTLTVMPESPRWLVRQGRTAEAEEILVRLNHPDVDVQGLLDEIQQDASAQDQQETSWKSVFFPETPGARLAVATGVGVAAMQQMLATHAILSYQPRILASMGVERDVIFMCLIAMGALKGAMLVVSTWFLDSRGRRPLLIISTAGMGAALVIIGFFFQVGQPWGAVAGTWFFFIAESIGVGPVGYLLAAEVFPLRIRAKAMALATIGNRITSTIISSTFLSWASAWGYPAYFYFFAVVSFGAVGVLYIYLPETNGKSLEQMAAYFEVVAAERQQGGAKALKTKIATKIAAPKQAGLV